MTQSLYDRIGGQEAVFATVKSFYDKIMADPALVEPQVALKSLMAAARGGA